MVKGGAMPPHFGQSCKKRSNTLIKESFILIIKTVETESGEILLPVTTQ